ncbi:uncharacterized protein BBA_09777 [Beauveria bassiana ARSEF 2860]|uniref:Uncharacterized protein n=1 Tax=Beauveria bassiana (strain ARSEF 2860) TaxID=655819 RepID=J4UFH5_BEAB2|nr:uncharacterized protein BBA_09777 [Beauveria bassiana ARSEF 2860]EJP61272.1 hypothetical protein BBA_09777 [Beauveria bassiana ARSEF 2860]
MSSPRQSNIARRRERDICRQALAQHIVSPSEVRLSPRPQDGYGWKPCPGYENTFSLLFAKNLSDHSISTYRLLSRQVGNTFEAVPAGVDVEATDHIPLRPSRGFSAEISRLQQENALLSGHVRELSDALENEVDCKLRVEKEKEQQHKHLQAAEDKIKELVEKARGYQAPLLKCFEELDRTVPILAELRRIAMEGVAPE